MTELTHLKLQIDPASEEDRERLAEVTQLLELDIERVDPDKTGEIPEGARGDPFTIGALILNLAATNGLFCKLIDTLQLWLTNRGRSSLSLEIGGDKLTLDGKPSTSQQQLIDLFIARHTTNL
jgi:hypothetical protein